ncbi:hypothetical protein RFI_09456 [Reticulomyxa filosa]|uniref:Uncharacterized protein n=1 Tax=Reticulomyxa filosa TaxID=46433 RepID=X6NP13_RETFI|nr:hypothetical protein RFI_09456 [Reticulomyxa filosa]|eukprot:ETO27673.1 hypothetical protein RFI_09456 [Reticulomyxa filosa]
MNIITIIINAIPIAKEDELVSTNAAPKKQKRKNELTTKNKIYVKVNSVLYPLFNGLLTGVRNDGDGINKNDLIPLKFGYPFSLVAIESLGGCFIFFVINVIERFAIPFFRKLCCGKSKFALSEIVIDPVSGEPISIYHLGSAGVYGTSFNEVGQIQAESNVPSSEKWNEEMDSGEESEESDNLFNKDNRRVVMGNESLQSNGQLLVKEAIQSSLTHKPSSIVHASIEDISLLLLSGYEPTLMDSIQRDAQFVGDGAKQKWKHKLKSKRKASSKKATLVLKSQEKQWICSGVSLSKCNCYRLLLKMKITMWSGVFKGLNSFLALAALFYLPDNLDFVFQSAVLVFIPLLQLMIPLSACKHPAKRYPATIKLGNLPLQISIGAAVDLLADLSLVCSLFSIHRLCKYLKKSQLRYANKREPSIAELSFFVSFWMFVIAFPLILLDIYENSFLPWSFNNNNDHNKSLFTLLWDQKKGKEIHLSEYLALGTLFHCLQLYATIGVLSVTNILSTVVLTQVTVICQVLYYFKWILQKKIRLDIWLCPTLSLIFALLCGFTTMLETFGTSCSVFGYIFRVKSKDESVKHIDNGATNDQQKVQHQRVIENSQSDHKFDESEDVHSIYSDLDE